MAVRSAAANAERIAASTAQSSFEVGWWQRGGIFNPLNYRSRGELYGGIPRVQFVDPKFTFSGARRLDGLATATHADIVKAFEGTGMIPSNHFIMRLKDVRTSNVGLRTFEDLQQIFRKGTDTFNRVDKITGHSLRQITHGRFNIVYDPVTRRLVTIEPN